MTRAPGTTSGPLGTQLPQRKNASMSPRNRAGAVSVGLMFFTATLPMSTPCFSKYLYMKYSAEVRTAVPTVLPSRSFGDLMFFDTTAPRSLPVTVKRDTRLICAPFARAGTKMNSETMPASRLPATIASNAGAPLSNILYSAGTPRFSMKPFSTAMTNGAKGALMPMPNVSFLSAGRPVPTSASVAMRAVNTTSVVRLICRLLPVTCIDVKTIAGGGSDAASVAPHRYLRSTSPFRETHKNSPLRSESKRPGPALPQRRRRHRHRGYHDQAVLDSTVPSPQYPVGEDGHGDHRHGKVPIRADRELGTAPRRADIRKCERRRHRFSRSRVRVSAKRPAGAGLRAGGRLPGRLGHRRLRQPTRHPYRQGRGLSHRPRRFGVPHVHARRQAAPGPWHARAAFCHRAPAPP